MDFEFLMDASDMHEKSFSQTEKPKLTEVQRQLRRIMRKINKQAQKGKYELRTYITLSTTTFATLHMLGYNITAIDGKTVITW